MSELLTETGLHRRVAREDYDRLARVNFSTLKSIGRSPLHYAYRLVKADKDTGPKKTGRATHLAVFEPDQFRATCALWTGGVRRGKEWDAFRKKNPGRDILTEAENEKCLAIQKAVRADRIAHPYVSEGQGEVTMLWTAMVEVGPLLQCKGRIDFDGATALVDLKSTRDASPDGFGREVWRYGYHVQAAWYSDAYYLATGIRKPYVLVAVEVEAPHVVQVYRVPEVVLELGRETYRAWLEKLAICREESRWPGYADGELELTLPKWAVDLGADEDLTGLDLEISQPQQEA